MNSSKTNFEKNIYIKSGCERFYKLGYFFIIGFAANLLLATLLNVFNMSISLFASLITCGSFIGCFSFLFFGLYAIKAKENNNNKGFLTSAYVFLLVDAVLEIFISLILPILTDREVYTGSISQESKMFLDSQFPIFICFLKFIYISVISTLSIINVYIVGTMLLKVLRVFSIIAICLQVFIFLASFFTQIEQLSFNGIATVIQIIYGITYSALMIFAFLIWELTIKTNNENKKVSIQENVEYQ